jgi:hypothetical protein
MFSLNDESRSSLLIIYPMSSTGKEDWPTYNPSKNAAAMHRRLSACGIWEGEACLTIRGESSSPRLAIFGPKFELRPALSLLHKF